MKRVYIHTHMYQSSNIQALVVKDMGQKRQDDFQNIWLNLFLAAKTVEMKI